MDLWMFQKAPRMKKDENRDKGDLNENNTSEEGDKESEKGVPARAGDGRERKGSQGRGRGR